jgi:hypothetical protein
MRDDAMQNTATLSIRLQQYPLWIIKPDGTSTNLDVLADDLDPNESGILDFETWIRENKDKYGITRVLDENWIEFDMKDLYEDGGMGVDAYLWDNQYTVGQDYDY